MGHPAGSHCADWIAYADTEMKDTTKDNSLSVLYKL